MGEQSQFILNSGLKVYHDEQSTDLHLLENTFEIYIYINIFSF